MPGDDRASILTELAFHGFVYKACGHRLPEVPGLDRVRGWCRSSLGSPSSRAWPARAEARQPRRYIAAALGDDLRNHARRACRPHASGRGDYRTYSRTVQPDLPGKSKRGASHDHHTTFAHHATSIVAGLAGSALLGLPTAARAEGTLEATNKRGTFRVGVTQAPPWFSKNPKSGEWTSGLGIDGQGDGAGARREDGDGRGELGTHRRAAGRQIDIMFTIDATPERKQAVDFPRNRRCSITRWPCWRRTTSR